MLPATTDPSDSGAERWQQRSTNAAGWPRWSRNNTTGSLQIRRASGLSRSSSAHAAMYQAFRINMAGLLSRCSIRLDVRGLDDRPPFLDGGTVQGTQRLRRLLIAQRDLLPEVGKASDDRWIGHRLDNYGVQFLHDLRRRALLDPQPRPIR